MSSMTYRQRIQQALSNVIKMNEDSLSYEELIRRVLNGKRQAGGNPAPHSRRLIHQGIVREVWAHRIQFVGAGANRAIQIVRNGVDFYSAWEGPVAQRRERSGQGAQKRRDEILVEYHDVAAVVFEIANILKGIVPSDPLLELETWPQKIRGYLLHEKRTRQVNAQLAKQVEEDAKRIQNLEVELRRHRTAVTMT